MLIEKTKKKITNFGFIGGCINYPNGIATEDTYHVLLKKTFPNINIHLNKYITYSGFLGKSKQFIEKESIDVLFVFIRHFPYMGLNKPFVKLAGENKSYYYRLHPCLFNRNPNRWTNELDKYAEINENNTVPERSYFGLRDVNLILGKAIGLHEWAFEYVREKIIKLKVICNSNNTKLIIIGPNKNPETYMGDKICTNLNKKIREEALKNHIDYIDINEYTDEYDKSIFQRDKIHFNEVGHKYLFRKIKNKIIYLLSKSVI